MAKYDFPGIQKLGTAGIRSALALSPYTAWLLSLGFVLDFGLNLLVGYLANNGLIILNVAANSVTGEIDQMSFDKAIDEAISKITIAGGVDKLTPAQKKAIDDEVIKAARKLIVIGKR